RQDVGGLGLSEGVDPKTDSPRGRTYQFSIHDLQTAGITRVGSVPFVKVAIDGRHGTAQTAVQECDLVAQRAQSQGTSSGMGAMNFKFQVGSWKPNDVDRPWNRSNAMVGIHNPRLRVSRVRSKILSPTAGQGRRQHLDDKE